MSFSASSSSPGDDVDQEGRQKNKKKGAAADFRSDDLPSYAKSYVLSRLTEKDRRRRDKRTSSKNRKGVVERENDVEFKLSMIRTSLDYEMEVRPRRRGADPARGRQTSRVSAPDSSDIQAAIARAMKNKKADVALPPPSRTSVNLTPRRKLSDRTAPPGAKSSSGTSSILSGSTPGGRSLKRRSGQPEVLPKISSGASKKSSKVPGCIGPGSLKKYINYVTSEERNYIPEPVLEPEKGVMYAIYAEDDEARAASMPDRKKTAGDAKDEKGDARPSERVVAMDDISDQFDAIMAQAEEAEKLIEKDRPKDKFKFKKVSSQIDNMAEVDMDFGAGGKGKKSTGKKQPAKPAQKKKTTGLLFDDDDDDEPSIISSTSSDSESYLNAPLPNADGAATLELFLDGDLEISIELELFLDPHSKYGGPSEKHPSLATEIKKLDNRKAEIGRALEERRQKMKERGS